MVYRLWITEINENREKPEQRFWRLCWRYIRKDVYEKRRFLRPERERRQEQRKRMEMPDW